MHVTNLNSILPQEEVHKHFALEGSRLYRKLATGAATQLKSRDGNQIVTLYKNQRLLGVDIAWCLIYGNWPMFPIVQIRADPLDFAEDNLLPARVKRLRYIQKARGGLYRHPLSTLVFSTPEKCRAHWETMARDHYKLHLAYILRLEADQRELRAKALAEMRAVRIPVPDTSHARPVRPARPAAIANREWHWYQGAWVDIPVACHVADDYRLRIMATLDGATVYRFDPETQMVCAYMPDGRIWMPPRYRAGTPPHVRRDQEKQDRERAQLERQLEERQLALF